MLKYLISEFDDEDGSISSSDMSEYGWEDDSDDEGKTGGKTRGKSGKPTKIKRPPSLDRYMDVMDRELAKTDVGKSFERQTKPQAKKGTKVYCTHVIVKIMSKQLMP